MVSSGRSPTEYFNHQLRFIDLFAGIGGIRLGVERAIARLEDTLETQCVLTCEIDKHARTTYQANFTDTLAMGHTFHDDICTLKTEAIAPHNLLLAGFPCQPFSQAGLKKGFQDTRGTMFFEIERILEAHRPSYFLLENVKQLKGHDKGRTLQVMLDHLEALGYTVYTQVLNAKHFGVPQNRERIYLVGIHTSLPEALQSFRFPEPPCPPVCVGDMLESLEDTTRYTLSDALWQGHQRRKQAHQAKGYGFGYSLFEAHSEYTSTLSARYYKDGSEILIAQADGKNPRKITPREAARLQGFPDHFVIPVSDTQAYKQFGNSVAVPVIEALITALLKKPDIQCLLGQSLPEQKQQHHNMRASQKALQTREYYRATYPRTLRGQQLVLPIG
jgi:DNA (cytosine-5)-methyltransferase 1